MQLQACPRLGKLIVIDEEMHFSREWFRNFAFFTVDENAALIFQVKCGWKNFKISFFLIDFLFVLMRKINPFR